MFAWCDYIVYLFILQYMLCLTVTFLRYCWKNNVLLKSYRGNGLSLLLTAWHTPPPSESGQLGCLVFYKLLIQNKRVLRLSDVRWSNFRFLNQFRKNQLFPAHKFDVFCNVVKNIICINLNRFFFLWLLLSVLLLYFLFWLRTNFKK